MAQEVNAMPRWSLYWKNKAEVPERVHMAVAKRAQ